MIKKDITVLIIISLLTITVKTSKNQIIEISEEDSEIELYPLVQKISENNFIFPESSEENLEKSNFEISEKKLNLKNPKIPEKLKNLEISQISKNPENSKNSEISGNTLLSKNSENSEKFDDFKISQIFIIEKTEFYPKTFISSQKKNFYIFTDNLEINFFNYKNEIYSKKNIGELPLSNIENFQIKNKLKKNNFRIFKKSLILEKISKNLCLEEQNIFHQIVFFNKFKDFSLIEKIVKTKKLDFLFIKLDSENYENFLFTLEIIMNGKMQYFWKSYEEIFSKTCLLKKKLKFSKNTKIIKNSKNLEIDEILGIDDIFILINVTKLKFSNFNTIIKKNIKNNDFLKKFVTKLIHEVFFFTHENIYFEKSEH